MEARKNREDRRKKREDWRLERLFNGGDSTFMSPEKKLELEANGDWRDDPYLAFLLSSSEDEEESPARLQGDRRSVVSGDRISSSRPSRGIDERRMPLKIAEPTPSFSPSFSPSFEDGYVDGGSDEERESHVDEDEDDDDDDDDEDDDDDDDRATETTVSSNSDMICTYCAGGGDAKRLVQCSLCGNFAHLSCYSVATGNNLEEVPEGRFVCRDEESCEKGRIALVRAGLIDDDQGEEVPFPFDIAFASHEASSLPLGSSSERFVTNLLRLKTQKPMHYASLNQWCETLHGVSKTTYLYFIDGVKQLLSDAGHSLEPEVLQRLEGGAPPLSIRRVLETCRASILHRVELKVPLKKKADGHNLEAFCIFHYRDPIDAAYDLHRSPLLHTAGPYYDWKDFRDPCSTKRLPDLWRRYQQFCNYNNLDPSDPSCIVIPVIFYFDDTQSKSRNRTACPCWLTSAFIDPTVREIVGQHAHVFLGFLPVESSVEIRFVNPSSDGLHTMQQARAVASLSHSDTKRYADVLRRRAYQSLFSRVAEFEQGGREYSHFGKRVTVRIMVCGIVMDMKERRVFLDLRRNKWHCMTCYDFPGVPLPLNEPKEGLRNVKRDDEIRAHFRAGSGADKTQKSFDAAFGRYGLKLKGDCPLLALGQDKSIFWTHGPYELCSPDLLHVKNGIVQRVFEMLSVYIGDDFVAESTRYGNIYLGTGKLAQHVFELETESMHFIPFAVMFGSLAALEHSDDSRQFLFHGVCDLLAILGLLNDRTPGLVQGVLRERLVSFNRFTQRLRDKILAKGGPLREITPKMHELIAHTDEHINRLGFLPSFSSKLFETLHRPVFQMLEGASSGRINDGSGAKEVILAMEYKRALAEVEVLGKESDRRGAGFRPGQRWQPRAHFVSIAGERQSKLSFQDGLKYHFGLITSILDVSSLVDLPHVNGADLVGNTLRMNLVCNVRETPASLEDVAVVPGTGLGMFKRGGALNVLAFSARPNKRHSEWQTCPTEGCTCFDHDSGIELFCSSCRDANTGYGIPVLFGVDDAYLIPLSEVHDDQLLPVNVAIAEMQCDFTRIVKISFKTIRGVSMMRPHFDKKAKPGRVFVFRYRRVFGYKGL